MKKLKKLFATTAVLTALASFAGCTSAAAVTLEEAKALVQETMGAPDAIVVEQETDRDDGVYELEILIDGVGYEFEVDSRTGQVREMERDDVPPVTTQTQPAETGSITLEEAKAIAYAHAGVKESDAYDKSQERDDGIYEIDFEYDGWDYEYDISPTGEILRSEKTPEDDRQVSATLPARISAQEALTIALNHAGVTDARDKDAEWDDGRWEVSFNSGRTEYEYVLDADGTIVHWEKETD